MKNRKLPLFCSLNEDDLNYETLVNDLVDRHRKKKLSVSPWLGLVDYSYQEGFLSGNQQNSNSSIFKNGS